MNNFIGTGGKEEPARKTLNDEIVGAADITANDNGEKDNLQSAAAAAHDGAKSVDIARGNGEMTALEAQSSATGGAILNCGEDGNGKTKTDREKDNTTVQKIFNGSERISIGTESGDDATQNTYSGGNAKSGAKIKNAENNMEQEKNNCGNTLYLVTGAHGFIGREVCWQLCAQGKRVRALIRKKRDDIPLPPDAEICTGDLLNTSSLEKFFQNNCGDIIVIHCAAVISVKKKSKACVDANVCGTQNIVNFCLKYKAKKLVYLGSVDGILAKKGEVVEEPRQYYPHLLKTDYAKSKAQSCAMVLAAQAIEFETAAVLPSAVIGPYDYKEGFITHILKIYTKGLLPRLSVKGGYDFVDVRDVAAAVITACGQGKKGSYIISNEYLSMTQVFDAFARRLGRKPTAKTFPMGVLYPLAAVASFFNLFNKGEPILTFSALDIMKNSPSYSHKKATEELNFHPRPLAETLNDTADYLRERIEKEKAVRKIKRRKNK